MCILEESVRFEWNAEMGHVNVIGVLIEEIASGSLQLHVFLLLTTTTTTTTTRDLENLMLSHTDRYELSRSHWQIFAHVLVL